MKRLLCGLLALSAIGAIMLVATVRAGDRPGVPDGELAAWVDQRIKERQPGPADRPFDEIGWAKDIRDALRLAKEHQRPVFLFTHDGRMNFGRC